MTIPNWTLVKRIFYRTLLVIVCIIVCFLWIIPTAGLFFSSFREQNLISRTPWWQIFTPPFRITLQNYRHVLRQLGMARAIFNTIIITVPSTVFPIVIAMYTSYALTWTGFQRSNLVFGIVVGLLVFPAQMSLIPLLRIASAFRLTGEYMSVWGVHTCFALPYSVYVCSGFVRKIPREIIESASIDGASHSQILYRIVFPLARHAIASLVIFQFMWTWNDLLMALVFLGTGTNTVPMTGIISRMTDTRGGGWEYYTAAAFIQMVLPISIFVFFQRYFVSGLLEGSVSD